MIFNVRVIPKSSRKLIKEEGGKLKAYLTKPAQDGLANAELIGLLSEYLQVRKYQIKIIRGHKSREKSVEIDTAC
jgi:uncharacterized protein (TIGR00251 family)